MSGSAGPRGFKPLLRSSGLATVASMAGNTLVYFAGTALGASLLVPGIGSISLARVLGASVAAVAGAAAFYAILRRVGNGRRRFGLSTRRAYRLAGALFLTFSFVGPLRSDADPATLATLSTMHAVTGLLAIWLIPPAGE